MKFRYVLLGAMAMLWASSASAQVCCRDTQRNWYVGFDGGLDLLSNYTTTVHNINSLPASLVFNRPGYNLNGSIGYRLNPFWRVEAEAGYYDFSLNKGATKNVNFIPLQAGQYHENQTVTDAMANLYFDLHNSSSFTPYIGAGGGLMHVHGPIYYTAVTGEEGKLIAWTPAMQFMAGVSYALHGPNLMTPMEITLGYRYVNAQQGEVKFKTVPGGSVDFDNQTQDVELGLRVYF